MTKSKSANSAVDKNDSSSSSQSSTGTANGINNVNGNGSNRGMVVYVDAQLRTSERFDAAGIERDYPEIVSPVARRRSSSSISLSGMSGGGGFSDASRAPSRASLRSAGENYTPRDEGQLRYWTSEMCSSMPHLFDFVITVSWREV